MLDTTRIRRLDRDQLEIWDQREYKWPQLLRGELYDRTVTKSQVRCGVQRSRLLESSLFKGDRLIRGSAGSKPDHYWSINGLDRAIAPVSTQRPRRSPWQLTSRPFRRDYLSLWRIPDMDWGADTRARDRSNERHRRS